MKKKERNIYLSNIPIEEAFARYMKKIQPFIDEENIESIKTIDAVGRIAVQSIFSKKSSPNHNAAAMDGIAVIAANTFGANESQPIHLEKGKDFKYVNTGNVVDFPYNAVIMIEDVVEIDENKIEIIGAATPWQHIRPVGEDIVENEMIIFANQKIRPMELGALLSGGIQNIEVYAKMKVGIIPTGSEIIEYDQELHKGEIYDSNSRVFYEMIKGYGGLPTRYAPVNDIYEDLKMKIKQALIENDMVIINAGSSAGSEDYTSKIIGELGEVVVHGIAIKPGKPTILGVVDGKPVIGIPGYPVSGYLMVETFVKPLVMMKQRIKMKKEENVQAILSRRVISSLKHKEYVRVKIGEVDHKMIVTPLNRGAGVTMSLVRADGIMEIERNCEGIEAGELVDIKLLRDIEDIHHTIVSIGSHDLIMDIIGSFMHKRNMDVYLSSAHVGSFGGLMALKRKEAHMAPIHLLDELTGEYNIAYIKKYLKNEKITLVKGVKRIQGLMIKKDNPKNIKTIRDFARADVNIVNRQKGSGTRILTDYLIKSNGVAIKEIEGYDREMTTHMSVASAIVSGTADVGVGVFSAAHTMGLDFIPIGKESYDFAISTPYMDTVLIKNFIEILKSDMFLEKVYELGGYEIEGIGEKIVVNK